MFNVTGEWPGPTVPVGHFGRKVMCSWQGRPGTCINLDNKIDNEFYWILIRACKRCSSLTLLLPPETNKFLCNTAQDSMIGELNYLGGASYSHSALLV